ncbi:hypothetical protein BG261_05535 [Floricoccus tropicus]|uniref:PcfJ-like protein n=1 Tax=Floricoccus tropicus TaxID=1859473 RepID=A0A1E8GKS6_9LACT|nr:PcfJ domain-containing protein [Floricoccus tropicus]OFI48851.1 hypothetical protein BG261_05535 [Floricoccus tropicus]
MKTAQDYIDTCLKPPKKFFEWCYSCFPTYIWSNKNETIVGSERKHEHVVKKRLTKNSKLSFYDRSEFFIIILSTSKRIEIQTYRIFSRFEDGKQKFDKELLNLEYLSNGEFIKVGLHNNYYGNIIGGKIYNFNKASLSNGFTVAWPYVYENDWIERIFRISELKYLQIEHSDYENLHNLYKYRKEIEYAQKIGAEIIARDIIEHNCDMRSITMNFLKRNKQFLKNSKRNYNDCLLKAEIEKRGIKFVPGVEKHLSKDDLNSIPKEVGLLKFQNYLVKQNCNFNYYDDYRNLLKKLDIEANSKSLILPKNLKVDHDKAVKIFNAKVQEERRMLFSQQIQDRKFYEMELDGYIFRLPGNSQELINEGKTLKHCVGTYIERHAEGETTIVFIREKSKPNVPFYTLEYKRGKLIQIRGEYNKAPSQKLKEVVDEWVELIQQKSKKVKHKEVA